MEGQKHTAEEGYKFPQGIPGFEDMQEFILIRDEEAPLAQLISKENAGIGFILIRPEAFLTDYEFPFDEESEEVLNLRADNINLEVWNILTLNSDVAKSTVNLQAPLCLNVTQRIGLQVILNDDSYALRYPLESSSREAVQEKGAIS